MDDKETQDAALGNRVAAVFSHPNHELAILGLIHKLSCPIVYLTDGGSPSRVASTVHGLARIGHRGTLIFLNRSEDEFYDALLKRNSSFFLVVAEELARHFRALQVDAIVCEGVELYNPVHDVTSPTVWRALREAHIQGAVYEVPLIYQEAAAESYIINRFPSSVSDFYRYAVPEPIANAKLSLYHELYHDLKAQFQALGCDISHTRFTTEYYRNAPAGLADPDPARILRYEQRGALLKQAGKVSEAITYRDHFLPTVTRLMKGAAR